MGKSKNYQRKNPNAKESINESHHTLITLFLDNAQLKSALKNIKHKA